MSGRPTAMVVTCRKCGAGAGQPILSDERYGGRLALFWECSDVECSYTWTLLIYQEPEVEVRQMRHRIRDLERADGEAGDE